MMKKTKLCDVQRIAKNGSRIRILSLSGIPAEAAARLRSLGIFQGSTALLVRKNRFGSVILLIRGTRLALGGMLAAGIEVLPL